MSFAQNIKRIRLEKNMTQEQLAAKLSVSAQAVSKWETAASYPDVSILVPLSKVLEVSLDELFDNDTVTMSDTSRRIIQMLYSAEEEEHFELARDLAWQIQRGLYNRYHPSFEKYDPDDVKKRHDNSSYIVNNKGFTIVSNNKEPFFTLVSEPKEGFGNFTSSVSDIQKIFKALSSSHTIRALIYLLRYKGRFLFEAEYLEKECAIPKSDINNVIKDLLLLKVIIKKETLINGEPRTLYNSYPDHKLIAMFLLAEHINYTHGYCLTGHKRTKPFLNKNDP